MRRKVTFFLARSPDAPRTSEKVSDVVDGIKMRLLTDDKSVILELIVRSLHGRNSARH